MIATGLGASEAIAGGTNVVVWDTGSALTDTVETKDRGGWVSIPSEMFAFEKDPAKAASDPGYYGRQYSFKGDAVVENPRYTVLFCSAIGRVAFFPKADPFSAGKSSGGQKVFEFVPLQTRSELGKITRCQILRNADDEVVIEAHFSGPQETAATFSLGRNEIVEIKPGSGMKGMSLTSPIDYAVVPGFIGDDLIFGPKECGSADTLCLPSENVMLGLLQGETHELVMTWPRGKQQLKVRTANDQQGRRAIESVDFENDGQSIYLALLTAPGIWHREELKPAYLEKDVTLPWAKPFPAKWKTQFIEAGVKTTFAFRESKGEIWRGVPGSYTYPAWFEGDKAFYHLGKKVPPKGESVIYFLEGRDTPLSVSTPVDIIQETLGRSMSELIVDPLGRTLRTHHRRGGDGVHRCCTCGCTEAIQAVFEAGQEASRKEDVQEALGDMTYFVQSHLARIDEYRSFADEMTRFLQKTTASSPELKPFLEGLEHTAEQIPQEYTVQKENMKSLEHAADLTRQTMSLTEHHTTNNLPAYMELLKAWRAMGGAQDSLVAQCHMITRKLFQEAGYGCVSDPKAANVAEQVRARCRRVLRNPDGYEIWADY
jgi:hypothetical protein